MENSARLFNCARCLSQVIICSDCDRGHIYCSRRCSRATRCASLRAAGKRYQTSPKGKHQHAKRQYRYRHRQKKVTHQGSPLLPHSDLLPTERGDPVDLPPVTTSDIRCHYCGRRCPRFHRSGFLQQSVNRKEANIFLVNLKRRIFNDNHH